MTEVLEEAPSEVVLEITPGEGLEALKRPPPEAPGPAEGPAESLEDFLASLKDQPAAPAAAAPAGAAAPLVDAAALRDMVRRELALIFQQGELEAAVREVLTETLDRLCREIFPQMAKEAMGREIEAMKKRLAGLED